jgi:hypothetical protein
MHQLADENLSLLLGKHRSINKKAKNTEAVKNPWLGIFPGCCTHSVLRS